MKKEGSFKKLMNMAGNHKYFSYASCLLAAISAVLSLIPYYNIWCIIKELLEVKPDFF